MSLQKESPCAQQSDVHSYFFSIYPPALQIFIEHFGEKITSLPIFFLNPHNNPRASNVYPSFIEEYAVYETFQLVNVGIKLGNLESYFLLYIISSHR